MSVSNEFKNITKKIKQQNIKLSICDGELTVKEVHMMPVHIFNALPVWKLRKQKETIAKELKYSFNGQLFKTIMKQVEITVKNANEIKDKDINFQYGLFINNKFEYVDLGNYFIKDVEDSKKKDEITVTGYDRMIRFMKTFKQSELQLKYPCKMLKLVQKMCEVCGVELYSTDFYNADLDVEEDFFTAQELTYRDVLEKIAQATLTTAFIEDNKLNLYKVSDDTIEKIDKSYLTDLTIKEKFGPVNVLVLGRGDVEDNIEETDKKSIEQNGRCEIRFDENEFIEFQREQVIKGMFEQIKGLEYYAFEASDVGVMWLKPCSCIQLGDKENNFYKSYYLKANITINTGISSDIEAGLPETTNTEYKVTTKEEKKTLKVERLAKKNEGLIQDLVQENSEQSQKLTKVEQTVDSISQKVSDIEDLTRTAEGIKTVTLENCIEANLLELHIYGNNTVFNYLLLDDKLTLDDDLYLEGDDLISVTDKDNNIKTYSLGITEALRQNSKVCDEVVLENGQVKVIRRVNKSGSTKAKESVEDLGKLEISLKEGTNTITINNYTAKIKAKYVIKSAYSNTFATKVEMNSEIKQTKESVDLSVNKKLEDYSTTTEMNSAISLKAGEITSSVSKTYETKENATKQYSNIKQTTDNITSVVGKKVGNDEIISKINQSAESVSIDAKKININGTVSANGNFLVDTDGNMKAKNGTFSGNIDVGENNYLRSKDSKGNILMQIDKNGTDYYFNNVHVGKIGTDGIETDSSKRGLLIAIDKDAYFLGLGKNDDDGVTQPIYTWYNVSTGDNGTYTANTQGKVQIGNANWGFLVSIFKKLLVHGNVYAESFVNTSLESQKKNFEKLTLEEAIDILNNTDIYKYNLKSQDDIKKKHIGFVIGDNFNYSSKITSEDNDGVDNYSMTSVLYPIVKEQQAQIEELKKEIETLKGEKND